MNIPGKSNLTCNIYVRQCPCVVVAVGSCTQISLFVVPLTVLVGWAADIPMTLNFPHFEIILYVMSVVTVSIVLNYPRVNWLEGSLLVTTYVMIAVGFWYENVSNHRPHRFAVQPRSHAFYHSARLGR
jgi:Ca2+/Na+ antiporter